MSNSQTDSMLRAKNLSLELMHQVRKLTNWSPEKPADVTASNVKFRYVDANQSSGGGKPAFYDLPDTPEDYVSHGGSAVRVKIDESGVEFVTDTTAAVAFYCSDIADGVIAGYQTLYRIATGEGQSTDTETITADGTLIQAYITEANQPDFVTLEAAAYDTHLHLSAVTVGKKDCTVYWTLTRRRTETYDIVAVNRGAKTFTIAEDILAILNVGDTIEISGSTGNDGVYTVASFVGNASTTITVVEVIPNAVADGAIVGIEQLMMTSEETGVLTNSETIYDVHATLSAEVILEADDRLVLKVYGNIDGAGSDPDATVYQEGVTTTRVVVAAPLSEVFKPAGSDKGIQVNKNGLFGAFLNFVYDDVNNRLGVGVAVPRKALHLSGTVPTIRLSDPNAINDQRVATLIEFYRGENTNRVGYLAMDSVLNDILALATDYPNGEIRFRTGNSVDRVIITKDGNVRIVSGDLQGGVTYTTHYINLLATALNHILLLRTWQDETVLQPAFNGNLLWPRDLTVTVFAGLMGAAQGTITFNGSDAKGNALAVVRSVDVPSGFNVTYTTNEAFMILDSIVVNQTDVNAGASYFVGIGDKYGLPNFPLNAAGDVLKIIAGGVALGGAAYVVNATYGTVDVLAGINFNDDYHTFYRPFK